MARAGAGTARSLRHNAVVGLRPPARAHGDISLLDARVVDHTRLHGPRQVTDAYLLALATAHDGRFVTFDRTLSIATVKRARTEHLSVL